MARLTDVEVFEAMSDYRRKAEEEGLPAYSLEAKRADLPIVLKMAEAERRGDADAVIRLAGLLTPEGLKHYLDYIFSHASDGVGRPSQ
jgi:hypothetical protein